MPRSSSQENAPRRWIGLAVLLVLLALRFTAISESSLYLDEAAVIFQAQQDGDSLRSHMARDATPPLHIVVLATWMRLFGQSELAVRSLSAVASALAGLCIFLLALRWFALPVALFASLIFAFSNVHQAAAHEARSFALSTLWVALGFLALDRFMSGHRWSGVTLGVCNALLLYTHYAAAFAIPAQIVAVAVGRRAPVLWLRRLFWVDLAALGLALPSFFRLRPHMWTEPSRWYGTAGLSDLWALVVSYSGSGVIAGLLALVLLLGPVLLFAGWYSDGLENGFAEKGSTGECGHLRWRLAVCASWFLVPVLLAFCVSPKVGLFVPKYLRYAQPGLFLLPIALAGPLVGRLGRRWRLVLFVPALIWLTLLGRGFDLAGPESQEWRSVASLVRELVDSDTLVVVSALYQCKPFSYYYLPDAFLEQALFHPKLLEHNVICVNGLKEDFLRHFDPSRALLIRSHSAVVDPDDSALAILSQNLTPVRETWFRGVQVTLLERPLLAEQGEVQPSGESQGLQP